MSPTDRPNIEIGGLRQRLAGTRGREYWRSLEEAAGSPDFLAALTREVPLAAEIAAAKIDRRQMLQVVAASAILASLAGCGPEEDPGKILPYVKAPVGMIPGVPQVYATATTFGGYATGVLVKHLMGRPIKIEGNPAHPASQGATDIWSQASILELYDPDRSQTPITRGRVGSWDRLTSELFDKLAALRPRHGAGLRIMTGSVTSPSLAAQLRSVTAAFPEARWHCWEPAGRDAVRAGAKLAFGRPLDVVLRPGKADVILGIESDFLSSAPGHLRYAREFAARRRGAEIGDGMSRLYAIESTPSLVGSKADHRLVARPDEIADALRALAARLGALPGSGGEAVSPFLTALAEDLWAHKGNALVHVGPSQPAEVHALAHAINLALGGAGRSFDLIEPVEFRPPDAGSTLQELVEDMAAGKIDTLLILGANPVFTAPADLAFAAALSKVPLSIHLGRYLDETGKSCTWHVPEAHEFEAWSDARAFDGTATIMQPQLLPLYGGRSTHEILALLKGELGPDGQTLIRGFWQSEARQRGVSDFESFWTNSVRDGVIADSASPPVQAAISGDFLAKPAPAAAQAGQGKMAILFRPDEGVWDGRFGNNGWLQELPRWHTKLVWDNAALIAPAMAQELGLASGEVIEIRVGEAAARIPVWVLPGQAPGCITLPLGFGRRAAGRVGTGIGSDVYPLRRSDGLWQRADITLRKTGERATLVSSQHHQTMAGRDLVISSSLRRFLEEPDFLRRKRQEDPDRPDRSLYPPHPYEGNAWAMSINLNSCIGCGACVIACQAENNIPVVGKSQAARTHLMHWIRIDRYYSGDPDAPDTHFQPVPCMHCENAPCEIVCPVEATVHDGDGLNLMVYNRCVGTRFCSNNCPYKVRRFNFFGYSDQDPRMELAWNPDVSVRGRGVMEKCTYCVQRIREAKIVADREDRPIREGEVVTACQAACPTQAIVFGDQNDAASAVAQRKKSPLDYPLLGELNTRPRTTYEAELRNRNPDLEKEGA